MNTWLKSAASSCCKFLRKYSNLCRKKPLGKDASCSDGFIWDERVESQAETFDAGSDDD